MPWPLSPTTEHKRAFQALLEVRTWDVAQEALARKENPDGLHRLSARVPELARSQLELARLLAEAALHNRAQDFEGGTCQASAAVRELFLASRDDDQQLDALIARSVRDPLAWDALGFWLHRSERAVIARGDDGVSRKHLLQIPPKVEAVFLRAWQGDTSRPLTKKQEQGGRPPGFSPAQTDAIIFAVWCALEADVKATGGEESACAVVASALGKKESQIAKVWQARKAKPKRRHIK